MKLNSEIIFLAYIGDKKVTEVTLKKCDTPESLKDLFKFYTRNKKNVLCGTWEELTYFYIDEHWYSSLMKSEDLRNELCGKSRNDIRLSNKGLKF
jgi:hypothetical protein